MSDAQAHLPPGRAAAIDLCQLMLYRAMTHRKYCNAVAWLPPQRRRGSTLPGGMRRRGARRAMSSRCALPGRWPSDGLLADGLFFMQ